VKKITSFLSPPQPDGSAGFFIACRTGELETVNGYLKGELP